jgi:hypothetical protein
VFRFPDLADALGFILELWVDGHSNDPEDLELYLSVFGLLPPSHE